MVVDLQKDSIQTVTTSQPVITGMAAPRVKIKVTVHSENQYEYELVADANGGFSLDLAKLQATLEPGEHTVTYSYVDPTSGQEVTKSQTFYVQPKTGSSSATGSSNQQLALAASPSPTPFGSGNPFTLNNGTGGTASSSASSSARTASGSASPSPSSSSSGRVSYPATTSGIPKSGSVGMTLALIGGGLFFTLAGVWSYWLAKELESPDVE
jgi:hypothetical protein